MMKRLTWNAALQDMAGRVACTGLGSPQDVDRVFAAAEREFPALMRAVEANSCLLKDKEYMQVRLWYTCCIEGHLAYHVCSSKLIPAV
jgi:hypothetical protein